MWCALNCSPIGTKLWTFIVNVYNIPEVNSEQTTHMHRNYEKLSRCLQINGWGQDRGTCMYRERESAFCHAPTPLKEACSQVLGIGMK